MDRSGAEWCRDVERSMVRCSDQYDDSKWAGYVLIPMFNQWTKAVRKTCVRFNVRTSCGSMSELADPELAATLIRSTQN